LKSRRRRLKEMLTDQTVMAGIGNIYADEILFQARLLPTRKADTLSIAEINRLAMSIKYVLVRGIRFRGTSIRDYVDGSGQPGKYQHLLKVYGKEGKPCPRCGQPIQRTKIAGRSAYFCNNCQR
ncbi:MAG: Fpg/Nei family DNA glycosylase, partial [Clostridia bacterium]|nr:Fpg/Nei family DNA glycosylase [Clostridia bacterium]